MAVTSRPRALTVVFSFLLDAAFIVAFAAAGRSSHARSATLAGLWETAWPFLAALTVSWLITAAWFRPTSPLWPGLGLWVGTLAGGMALRAVAGQGTALPFVLVAAGTLLLFLVGWRLVAALTKRVRARAVQR